MSHQTPEAPLPEAGPIQEPTFSTSFRGFDPGQVSDHVRKLTTRIRILEHHVSELESELEQAGRQSGSGLSAASSADPFEAVSDRVTEVIRTFDQDVGRMRSDAADEARRIVEQAENEAQVSRQAIEERRTAAEAEVEELLTIARAEADRVRVDAQAKAEDVRERAERALDDARARAEAMISDLEIRRGSLVEEIRALRDRMVDVVGGLAPVLEGQPGGDVVVVEEAGRPEDRSEASTPITPAK